MVQRPATTAVVAVCSGLWLRIKQKEYDYPDVAASYNTIVHSHQYWRLLVSQFAHIDLLHLLFNMASLWSLGIIEQIHGSAFYLRMTLVMLVITAALELAAYHVLIKVLKREQSSGSLANTYVLGYSGIVFGWMAAWALGLPGSATISLLGFNGVPAWLYPILSLAITHIIVPKASLIGHCSGIAAGALVGLGAFDWVGTYWAVCLATWVAIGVVYGLVKEGVVTVPFVTKLGGYVALPGLDVEGGQGAAVVRNGVLARS
jgi:membrane associated rhomboid family serine protease